MARDTYRDCCYLYLSPAEIDERRITMRSYEQIRASVINANKGAKYERMMAFQENIIEQAIKDGRGNGSSVLFIFSDREQFHGIEKEWFGEFYSRAKKEVENAGYEVRGSLIYY